MVWFWSLETGVSSQSLKRTTFSILIQRYVIVSIFTRRRRLLVSSRLSISSYKDTAQHLSYSYIVQMYSNTCCRESCWDPDNLNWLTSSLVSAPCSSSGGYEFESLPGQNLGAIGRPWVRSSTKNRFSNWKSPQISVFWWTFYRGQRYIFEISTKRRIFWYPIRPIQRKKGFHLIEKSMCTFFELKSPKCKQPLNIFL